MLQKKVGLVIPRMTVHTQDSLHRGLILIYRSLFLPAYRDRSLIRERGGMGLQNGIRGGGGGCKSRLTPTKKNGRGGRKQVSAIMNGVTWSY